MDTLRPILQPVLQPVLRSVFDPPMRGGGGDPLLKAILKLFANGEEGALYYLTDDFSGLYQDAAGTTPVTAVGQPVGLMLDRRFGLERGQRREENGDFATSVDGWEVFNSTNVFVSWQSPGLLHSEGSSGGPYQDVPVTAGAWVEVSVRLRVLAGELRLRAFQGGAFSVQLHQSVISNAPEFADYKMIVQSPTSSIRVYLNGMSAHEMEVDSVSVREVPGNHASQQTTTARPTLRSGPLRIDYDGADDFLRTEFPNELGSNVTIARSIPGEGAQILTGQTVGTEWDDDVTSCATLVIDRALSGSETALVTAFLNQQAGV